MLISLDAARRVSIVSSRVRNPLRALAARRAPIIRCPGANGDQRNYMWLTVMIQFQRQLILNELILNQSSTELAAAELTTLTRNCKFFF